MFASASALDAGPPEVSAWSAKGIPEGPRDLWSQTPYLYWFLGPESLNIGYLDPLGM